MSDKFGLAQRSDALPPTVRPPALLLLWSLLLGALCGVVVVVVLVEGAL
jgi:hypothetical protein